MRLVIVESPAKAKTINKYLGNEYKVIASYGHIRALPSKTGSVKPDEDFKMQYEILAGSDKAVKMIEEECKKSSHIFLATDPDREGEAISWHIIEEMKNRGVIKKQEVNRVAFNEITKSAVLNAIKNPRNIDQHLVEAQLSRVGLDYLVGFTLSPILWKKLPGSRSAGRVQSVALRLICDRESEIEQFNTQEYWDIKITFKASEGIFTALLTHIKEEKLDKFHFKGEKEAKSCAKKLETLKYSVFDVQNKEQKRNPQPPFNTSALQQDGVKRLGFSAKKIMQLAQKLYEGIEIGGEATGLITYMRTDGVQISNDAIKDIRNYIQGKYGSDYLPPKARIYKTKTKNAQEAHEAIRPTNLNYPPEKLFKYLDKDMLALYSMIWNRTIASQMEAAILDVVTIIVKDLEENYTLRASGSTIKFLGFMAVYQEIKDEGVDENTEGKLPVINKNEKLDTKKISPEQHFTEPPARFSEASLVKKLEELGIGRPSTYASIISVLQDREYVKLDKKRFVPEERGRIVTTFLKEFFTKYVEYDFTAELENNLDLVSNGEINYKELLKNFWDKFYENILKVSAISPKDINPVIEEKLSTHLFGNEENNKKCPECEDGKLGLKMGKFGAFIGCSNYPECKYIKNIEEKRDNKNNNEFPKVLGRDKKFGTINLCHGRYGYYLEAEIKDAKDKQVRATIPKNFDPLNIDLEAAISILSLPKILGNHPETNLVVNVNIGKYGPYVGYNQKFYPMSKNTDIFSTTLEDALTYIEKSPKKEKETKNFTIDGKIYTIQSGKFGPYFKYGKKNISTGNREITEDYIRELINKHKNK